MCTKMTESDCELALELFRARLPADAVIPPVITRV